MTPEDLSALLRQRLRGRAVVVGIDLLFLAARVASDLRAHGAEVLGVVGTTGIDELEPEDRARARTVDVRGPTMMSNMLRWDAAFVDADPVVLAALDDLDPQRRAAVHLPFWSTATSVGGRPVLGARDPAWIALDDKTVVDAVWDDAGVSRAPVAVVDAADADALARAHVELAGSLGTAWAADNRRGWHGGADGVRWVPSADDVAAAAAWAADRADRVRVMPFLDGLPCSIHALVTADDHVATFRPCEMVVFRDRAARSLRYGGAATAWEPAAGDAAAMREVAARVGAHLRDTRGYRGFLTVDGVMTADGFLPTELNPRFGAALHAQAHGADLPLELLHALVIDGARGPGPEPSWPVEGIEQLVRGLAGDHPSAGGHVFLEGVDVEAREAELVVGEDAFTAKLAPTPFGARLRIDLAEPRPGRPVAPRLAPAIALAAAELGVDVPPLEPAPILR